MYKKLLAILMLIFSFSAMAKDKLKIGVTLQPYYSFVVNIVKDKAEVIPVVRLDKYDSHSYQPKPEDIKRINELDILVVNGVGHDEFIFDILNAGFDSEAFAVGARKADMTLVNKINEVFYEMYKDGKFQEISNKWFGEDVATEELKSK